MSLQGQVAIVTGGARGLGRAYVLRLARLGADIAIADIDLDGAARYEETLTAPSVREEVLALGRRAIDFEADLSRREHAQRLVERTVNELGRVDILVNNAGGLLTPIERSHACAIPEEDIRATLDANLMIAVFCCQAVIPHMKTQRSGVIVNVSSAAARNVVRGGRFAMYGAAKAAVTHFTRNLAMELGPFGIRANCIAPGLIHSSRMKYSAQQRNLGTAADIERIPLGRAGEPEDCAKVVEFLVTDLSSFVTGQCISVCGGSILTPA
ncbi:MAG TPA: SDR family NAD(P)-dependent oxidoreductase [Ramlibacter sp.]|uniref:SDR family NAD(P)-dependent oxidoreductase n=1 Tax=Ramlibacter sp. TaxID=1917967 RepID=UPI002B84AFC6|nr:SDR family NAD(P)-dependent oxidoreductase [Ramlibacter sp.]HVZ45819.1 SDR family NAD(P)-dependent oxidoreductase [Ramlibacter sp.]